jgi:pilus assembly protein FimV
MATIQGRKGGKGRLPAAVRTAVIAYGATASMSALSLGLGEIEMQSFLNEPLRAEVELLDTRQLTVDDIRIRLAGVDDFDRMGVERSYFLTSIQFEIDVNDSTGRGVIRLSTDEAVLEPYLDLIIEARWPSGRLLREYTVLVDPPAFKQDVVTVSASERVEATNPEKPALAPESKPMPETSTGDTVAVRQSSLPPGAMPERAFSAETASSPAAGNRYLVKRDETLWQIASQGKPDGISVQQAMLDIQRMNPEAFINGNINQIKAGYIIYLPAAGEISSDDLARALDEVREQNQEWRSGRSAPGVTAAATLRVSADSSSVAAADTDTVEDRSSAVAGTAGDRVPTETAAPGAYDAADDGEEPVPAGETVGSSELAAQLDAMASRLDTLEQIVALKDEQIATLEQALREAREAASAAASAAPVASAPVVQPQPAPVPAPAPAAQPSSGGIPWLPISGGLLAIVLGAVLFLRRRAGQEPDDENLGRGKAAANLPEEDDVFAGVSLKKDALEDPVPPVSVPAAAAAVAAEAIVEDEPEEAPAPPTDSMDRGGSRGYGERKHDDYIDDSAASDALAEADIYIAYGRYLQAIELLNAAINNEPGNGAYRLKLIELYVDMGEDASAEEQLEALRAHGSPEAVARGEALVGGGAAPAPAVAQFAVDEADDAADSLDFDTPLEFESTSPADAADAADRAQDGVGLDVPELELEDAATAPPLQPPAAQGDDESIEFDFLEIEEDLPLAAVDDGELDFTEAEAELDLSDAFMSDTAAPESDQEPGDEVDDEDLLIADDADQMATKLDLARAYIDMGDSEGARGILEEVAEKGTADQQQEASELLSRIG